VMNEEDGKRVVVDSRIALGPSSLMSVEYQVGDIPRPAISAIRIIDYIS